MDSQGSRLFYIDDVGVVTNAGCVSAIDPIDGGAATQRDVTCLSDLSRRFKPGLKSPGTASTPIYFEPDEAGHIKLFELYKDNKIVKWLVALSDSTATPAVDSNGDWGLTSFDGSAIIFDGYISAFPFSLAQDSELTVNASIQISGEVFVYDGTMH